MELCKSDQRFEAYREILFSVNHKNRESEDVAFNRKLDINIVDFLRLLSTYFLLLPAQQVLEFLIRRYKYVTCMQRSICAFPGDARPFSYAR